tara:strand:+ start:37 stop:585 length:549 start_codon:yes stop_codon:yes gene_type:complete
MFVEKKQKYDYVKEEYLRLKLNEEYPLWSWSPAGNNPVQFLGSEWVIVSGTLRIDEDGFTREFFSPGAARLHYASNKERTLNNIIDTDHSVGSANTNGLKRAINRLTNIADDVYKKQMIDPSLDALDVDEIEMIESMMEELDEDTKNRIRDLVENWTINKTNLERTIEKIERDIIKKRSKDE